ncbi:cystathionine gamma-synthase [Streptococcus sp. DD13]|uniref:cystathionine gamma-synthase n=1 Tax=Streptococcus sp. DD13 TaxID=1777881 RepID=UPI0007966688|nr:cystathionine gamma-synthase [Streptococcus sp. DD13]KXT78488.1 Cystathionine gamma-synthase [Streptococcus sp. DD13]
MTEFQRDTILAHAGIRSDEKTGALIAPIYLSTTYQHPEFGQSTGYDYTRTKNPTRALLEETLAAIEKADHAVVTSSGMAALVLLFNGFPTGSKIVAARDLYGGSYRWFQQQEEAGRFAFTYCQTEVELLESISEETDYVFIETPTNPLMVEFDIETLAKATHAVGAKLIVDNTFYSPIYQNPIPLGADVVLHSATKYLSGHNDVLGGVLITSDQELYEKIYFDQYTTGPTLSPLDSYLLMRGLKTLSLRMERSTQNALKVVDYLQSSPAVKEVLYTGKGGMVSFKVVDEAKIPSILNRLRVFTFAESLGGVESLITYPATQTHIDVPRELRYSYGLTDDLLRLSIGIEDAQDLIQDLRQALEED